MSRGAFALAVVSTVVCGAFVGCADSVIPHPREPHVTAARTHYPDATRALLEEGRGHYIDACGGCHAVPLPSSHRAEDWPAVVGSMSARAHLDPARRRAIEAYLIAVAPQ